MASSSKHVTVAVVVAVLVSVFISAIVSALIFILWCRKCQSLSKVPKLDNQLTSLPHVPAEDDAGHVNNEVPYNETSTVAAQPEAAYQELGQRGVSTGSDFYQEVL